jgi:phosphate-selective porin OprO/OprP
LQSRWPSQDNGSAGAGSTLRYRSKPETDVSALRLVDTGEIAGGVRRTLALNPEVALGVGAFSLQAEYMAVRVERARAENLDFKAWYVQTSYTLSGEPRPYRSNKGVFDGIKPATPFARDGGWGAWELAARWSALDLSDQSIRGGRERNATLGLNWYPNALLRSSVNVIKVLSVDGGPRDGDEPTIYQLRLQLAY